MILKVFKYPLYWEDSFEVEMPGGAELIHFDNQRGTPTLWALVDPEMPTCSRKFRLAGTGHPIEGAPLEHVHVGSALFINGELVFHLFEVRS